ncbi:FAR1 DNA-binding domain [Musa troglodytarum]|uniref:FAR1 DNA-binding domain n=1 Tax=Musa troglodytarum TaxID=320322 RepID=A0A9E7GTE3_9LILI|nr:FAR1 DNA-binding domain [Musa troglodytarum]URE16968.1 FAR1 DNA-binding domain [Musa troglodytarum]
MPRTSYFSVPCRVAAVEASHRCGFGVSLADASQLIHFGPFRLFLLRKWLASGRSDMSREH